MSRSRTTDAFIAVLGCATLAAGRADAAGSYYFCGSWGYQYTDQGLGEDRLTHYQGTYGASPAWGAWKVVLRDGVVQYANYTRGDCTEAIPAIAGRYEFILYPAMYTSEGAWIWVFPTRAREWRAFAKIWDLPGLGSGSKFYMYQNVGLGDPVAGVAAVGSTAVLYGEGLVADQIYEIFVNDNCPGQPFVPCGSDAGVWLGADPYGRYYAYTKYIVTHEFGHAVQGKLMGVPSHPYDQKTSSDELCRCYGVAGPDGTIPHCLQSRESTSTAQYEGFAHFWAVDLLNLPSEEDATFGYYKYTKLTRGGGITPPPLSWAVYQPDTAKRWLETNCVTNDAGVEADWLSFFWRLNNKGTARYTYQDLRDVYQEACGGGTCKSLEGDAPGWAALQAAATAVFGSRSPKSGYWRDNGIRHGVAH